MKKSIALLVSLALLTTLPITTINSYADAKPKTTQTKVVPKLTNADIMAKQDAILIKYLDLLSQYDDFTLEAYLYSEIGEGTYDSVTEYIEKMRSVVKQARQIIKDTKKPIPTDTFNKLVKCMNDMAETFSGL